MKNLNIKIDEGKRHGYKIEAMLEKLTLGEWVIKMLDEGKLRGENARKTKETQVQANAAANMALLTQQVAQNPNVAVTNIPVVNPPPFWAETPEDRRMKAVDFNFTED